MATLRVVTLRRSLALASSAVALFASGLVLASCGSDDEEAAPTETTITQSTQTVTATMTTETTTTTTQPEPAGPTVVRIAVVNGAPKRGIVRETVEKDDRVVLVVTSDVTDHIHLHGYDIMRDVAPGSPARLPFKATIPGRFEVELEDRGVPIADITVRP
jgi:carbamoylphosphate synthase small subunit